MFIDLSILIEDARQIKCPVRPILRGDVFKSYRTRATGSLAEWCEAGEWWQLMLIRYAPRIDIVFFLGWCQKGSGGLSAACFFLSLSLSLLISNFIETLHFKPRGLFIHGLLRRFIVESEWFMKRGFKGGPLSSSLNTTSFRSGLHSIWRHLNDISILNTLWTGAASHCQHQIGVTHPGFTPNWGGES